MSTPTHVLVFGDDGSAGADVAWLWINNQPWPHWQLDVVHAEPPAAAPPPPRANVDVHPWYPPRRRAYLAGGVEVSHLTAAADPREVLSRFTGADLMVVGPRGRGLLKALHLGSTSEWLLDCPPCPFVIARSGQAVKRALVCVDGSPHAQAAVEAYITLPLARRAAATVFTAGIPYGNPPAQFQQTIERLGALGAEVSALDRTPRALQPFVSVRDMILDAATETGADLIVLGTRGLSGWESLRVGSIAGAVARHATVSVLLARAEQTRQSAVGR